MPGSEPLGSRVHGAGVDIRRRLRRHIPLLLAGLFLLAWIVGAWGFTRHQAATGSVQPMATRLYLAVQLFVLESGGVAGPLPWQLELARVLAPVVAAYALLATLAAVLTDQVRGWRLGRIRGHVVVVGLGEQGSLLCAALTRRGRQVVGVDLDPGSPALAALRAERGLVVAGDGRLRDTLLRARLHRATNLVVLCGDDQVTTEVVATARRLLAQRAGTDPVRCVGLLSDSALWTLLAIQQLRHVQPNDMQLDFLNGLDVGAQALVRRHAPVGDAGGPPAIVMTGWNPGATRVLLALVRDSGFRHTEGRPLTLAMVGVPDDELESFRRRHPEVDHLVKLTPAASVREAVPPGGAVVMYVCEDSDAAAIDRILECRGVLASDSQIVVVQKRRTALGNVLGRPAGRGDGPAVATFGLLDEACRPEVLMGGTTELLAQALHRMYLEGRAADGAPDDDDPAVRPWEDLPESLRNSNRDQAGHLAVKLDVLGRGLGPLSDWNSARAALAPEEIERLSEFEHERWVAERQRAGWRPGPRDVDKRTTPHLVPWSDLSEEVRDYDRLFVRQLPRLLATIGLQVLPRCEP